MVPTGWKIEGLSRVVTLFTSVSLNYWLIGFGYGFLRLLVEISLLSFQGGVLSIIFFFVKSLLEDTILTQENLGVL